MSDNKCYIDDVPKNLIEVVCGHNSVTPRSYLYLDCTIVIYGLGYVKFEKINILLKSKMCNHHSVYTIYILKKQICQILFFFIYKKVCRSLNHMAKGDVRAS